MHTVYICIYIYIYKEIQPCGIIIFVCMNLFEERIENLHNFHEWLCHEKFRLFKDEVNLNYI